MLHSLTRKLWRSVAILGTASLVLLVPLQSFSLVKAQNEYVTISSFSGHPGVSLQIQGGGYEANEQVHVFFDSASIVSSAATDQTVTASSWGEFGPVTLTVPFQTAQGGLAITAEGVTSHRASHNSYYVVPFAPSITTSATSNTPHSVLSVDGSGFAASEPVTISLATSSVTVAADEDGVISGASLMIPQVDPGTALVTAKGGWTAAQAVAYFYVGGFYPAVWPSTYYLLPGRELSFSGNGFAPSEVVKVYDGTASTPISSLTVDATGAFEELGGFAIPLDFAGTSHTFRLHGVTSNAEASVGISVGSFYPDASPSAYYILPGSDLSFNATNFAPNEQVVVTTGLAHTQLSTAMTDENGALEGAGSFTVPFDFAGSARTFTLTGQSSHASANVTVTVGQYNPNVSPSSWYVLPGQTISFSGNGFATGENVMVYRGMETNPFATFVSDVWGGFVDLGSDQVAYNLAGKSASYRVVGASSHAATSFTIGVGQLFAQISPSDYYLRPAHTFTLSGTGFAPNEEVSVVVGSETPVTVMTDEFGGFSADSLTMPFTSKSSLVLSATGATSGVTATATVSVGSYYPYADADSYYARQGTIVHVQGHSFAANEPVTITAGGTSVMTTANALGNTDLVPVMLPFGTFADNKIVISLEGSLSHASVSVPVTIAPFTPQVSPSTYYAAPGSAISFTGTGFLAGETVTIKNGTAVIGSATATAMGDLVSDDYVLPFGSNTTDYTFIGETSGATVSVSVGLSAFYAGVSLNNYYAVGGTPVTVSGSGYYPGEMVNITFGGANLGTASVNSDGAFSKNVQVPFATPGDKSVVVTGLTSGASATTTFTQAPVYTGTWLSSYAGAPGSSVTILGSGYLANEPVQVTTDKTGSAVVYSFNANADGSLSGTGFTIPTGLAEGNLTITVKGTHSLNPQSIVYYVTAE